MTEGRKEGRKEGGRALTGAAYLVTWSAREGGGTHRFNDFIAYCDCVRGERAWKIRRNGCQTTEVFGGVRARRVEWTSQ